MKIHVGIIGRQTGWQNLLQQEGVPFSFASGDVAPDDYSVLVVGDDANERESEKVRLYLQAGGAVLCSASVDSRLRHTTDQRIYLEYVKTGNRSHFSAVGLLDIDSPCHLAWKANDLESRRGLFSAYVGPVGQGHVIALPFDPSVLVLDERSAVRSFYSPEKRLPFETVSLVSKGTLRLLTAECLEILHHRRGLPYIHLWYYPRGAHSIFCFRIDTDYGSKEQIGALRQLAQMNRIPMTWFLDVKSHESYLQIFAEMKDQEIGIHCYNHVFFPDIQSNIANIQKAADVLKRTGIAFKAYAAPYGKWNAEFGKALASFGFEYSSEFSYDYDNLPGDPGNGMLQVPVHPICIGSLKRHSYTDEMMIRYFDFVIRRKLAVREPMFFYHHPRDGHEPVLEWIFEAMRRERIASKTMGEFSAWWLRRMKTSLKCESSGNNIRLNLPEDGPDDVYVRITKSDGTEAIIPRAAQIAMETVRWEAKPAAFLYPDDFLRQRSFNYRIPLTKTADALHRFFSP
ncbi:MAG: polysaccharide deacetylase family protein [Bacteroidota bacterium]